MKKETSWGSVSDWYSNYLDTDNDSYHSKVILPNLMRLVNPIKDEVILDLACGEGFFCRELEKAGSRVSGVDVSTELINLAKQKSSAKIFFDNTPSNDLNCFSDSNFNKAICVLAFQNIEDIDGTLKELSRVIEDGGTFTFVLNHPSFRVPGKSSWLFDPKTKTQSRNISAYMNESKKEIIMNPQAKDSPVTVSFHRPLQYYVKFLAKNGFAITRIEEWISHKRSEEGPRQKEEDRIRKEIPMFMCIETKLSK